MTDTENVIKLVVIGDLGVGKTSIIRRYVESDYSPEYRISVQLDFKQKQVSLGDRKLNLQLWDVSVLLKIFSPLKSLLLIIEVPGNERFGGMTSVYYKYSSGALVTFDLARYVNKSSVVHRTLETFQIKLSDERLF